MWQLRDGAKRFTYIKESVRGITQKMLTQQLRELEADGIINRTMFMEVPMRVEYSLTPRGESLFPILQAMADWGFAQHPEAFNVPMSRHVAFMSEMSGDAVVRPETSGVV